MWLVALKSLAGTSRLGERPKNLWRKRSTVAPYFSDLKKYGANAPQLRPILKKYGANAPQLHPIFITGILPVSPSPQPRAPRPAGTLPYAYSSPARQSSHAPPGTHGPCLTPGDYRYRVQT